MKDLFGIDGYCLEKRANIVLERGAFITTRHTGRYCICLYHMGHYFAELWYLQPQDEVVLVRGFENETYLETYFQEVDVSELIP